MKIDKKHNISDDVNLYHDKNGIDLNNPNFFLTFSDFNISDGIDIVENILVLSNNAISLKNTDKVFETVEKYLANNNLTGSYIFHNVENTRYFVNTYDDISVITLLSNDVEIKDFYNSLKVAKSKKDFEDAKIDFNQIIIIDKVLSPKLLIKLHIEAVKERVKFFDSLNLPVHIDNIVGNDDFMVIASNMPKNNLSEEEKEFGIDITSLPYEDDKINIQDLIIRIQDAVSISLEESFKKSGLSFGILDFLESEGIKINDLVDAGMALVEGVPVTNELKEKLKLQIYKSLEDINVIALLLAAIRVEYDFSNNLIREVNVEDDPAYLYTDEVLGLAIANQIAGTKARFNFKRYDDAKPGILSSLGPMVDDIFGGLIAGCMSKIFEEN
ncbi:phosphatidylglycerophosphatase [Methanobrevibacter sp. 87.7]|uniref:phosphatidylglycerophosphatase A n=1 Tax=Methanobrevibacter sp. 87.7 TaxID=387957 RepID=UPI000B514A76|nr:phosphatidylglycerophosphatase A [Methanobrevibacter sp. 87.7]OWT33206.1 phosphatidylglycerophosphatase [Methanobrevibacter sp. 87.7]